MKKVILLAAVSFLAVAGLSAQNTAAGAANGMTLNGVTGIIVVPDARIGWENSQFGLDLGYGFVWNGGRNFDHLPRFALSLVKKVEIHGLFEFDNADNEAFKNFVLGTKVQLYKEGGSALALGGDLEFANEDRFGQDNDISSKIYLAATYAGTFFDAPAVTSATIGWQMFEAGDFSSQFVYGMGFSMSLFPKAFKNYVFWITDFSNFSYTVQGAVVNANSRGAFNTGVRIRPIKDGRFNMIIDILGTDLLDDGDRGMSANLSGGMAF